MDFIIGFPCNHKQHDSIAVVMVDDQVSTFSTDQDFLGVDDHVRMYIQELVKLHGVPLSIILDRRTQFTLHI